MPLKIILQNGGGYTFMKKNNVLQGKGDSFESILPRFTAAGIPIVKQEVLSLTRLHDKEYWNNLSQRKIDLALLDQRHWFYPDDVFKTYVKKISSHPFCAVCMFDSPFEYEDQLGVDASALEKKFHERSKILSTAIRSRQKTIIVSPSLTIMEAENQKRFVDYLVYNRSLFDVYGMHCCMDVTDHSMGFLLGLLNQALTCLRKPVWVTRWAVPSCEYSIESSRVIQPERTLTNYKTAARNLKTMYQVVGDLATDSRWFFAGAGADIFHPDKSVSYFWDDSPYLSKITKWSGEHFLGLVTPEGEIKEEVLEALLQMHSAYN